MQATQTIKIDKSKLNMPQLMLNFFEQQRAYGFPPIRDEVLSSHTGIVRNMTNWAYKIYQEGCVVEDVAQYKQLLKEIDKFEPKNKIFLEHMVTAMARQAFLSGSEHSKELLRIEDQNDAQLDQPAMIRIFEQRCYYNQQNSILDISGKETVQEEKQKLLYLNAQIQTSCNFSQRLYRIKVIIEQLLLAHDFPLVQDKLITTCKSALLYCLTLCANTSLKKLWAHHGSASSLPTPCFKESFHIYDTQFLSKYEDLFDWNQDGPEILYYGIHFKEFDVVQLCLLKGSHLYEPPPSSIREIFTQKKNDFDNEVEPFVISAVYSTLEIFKQIYYKTKGWKEVDDALGYVQLKDQRYVRTNIIGMAASLGFSDILEFALSQMEKKTIEKEAVCKKVVGNNSEIQCTSLDGYTPLQLAVFNLEHDSVEILVKASANHKVISKKDEHSLIKIAFIRKNLFAFKLLAGYFFEDFDSQEVRLFASSGKSYFSEGQQALKEGIDNKNDDVDKKQLEKIEEIQNQLIDEDQPGYEMAEKKRLKRKRLRNKKKQLNQKQQKASSQGEDFQCFTLDTPWTNFKKSYGVEYKHGDDIELHNRKSLKLAEIWNSMSSEQQAKYEKQIEEKSEQEENSEEVALQQDMLAGLTDQEGIPVIGSETTGVKTWQSVSNEEVSHQDQSNQQAKREISSELQEKDKSANQTTNQQTEEVKYYPCQQDQSQQWSQVSLLSVNMDKNSCNNCLANRELVKKTREENESVHAENQRLEQLLHLPQKLDTMCLKSEIEIPKLLRKASRKQKKAYGVERPLDVDQAVEKNFISNFVCSICLNVVSSILSECIKCHHLHCKSCIQSWLKNKEQDKKSCPFCRNEYRPSPKVNYIVRAMLDKLSFECWEPTCKEIFEFQNKKQHQTVDCKALRIICPLNCGMGGFDELKQLRAHLETECSRTQGSAQAPTEKELEFQKELKKQF